MHTYVCIHEHIFSEKIRKDKFTEIYLTFLVDKDELLDNQPSDFKGNTYA